MNAFGAAGFCEGFDVKNASELTTTCNGNAIVNNRSAAAHRVFIPGLNGSTGYSVLVGRYILEKIGVACAEGLPVEIQDAFAADNFVTFQAVTVHHTQALSHFLADATINWVMVKRCSFVLNVSAGAVVNHSMAKVIIGNVFRLGGASAFRFVGAVVRAGAS